MTQINENYRKLPGSYLFSEIAGRVRAYSSAHPEADIVRLGIGDVTRPLAPAVVEALHAAVEEMGKEGSFRGYHKAWDRGCDKAPCPRHYKCSS